MKKLTHLRHAIAVVWPLALAGAAGVATSPAWRSFVEHHAAVAGYVLVGAGALRAGVKAWSERQRSTSQSSPFSL